MRCPIRATAEVAPSLFDEVRRELVLHHCKWDPQVGDVGTVAAHALVIEKDAWNDLATLTESLAAELAGIEDELAGRPELHADIGVPTKLQRLFRNARFKQRELVRTLRFDFHWTGERFVLSEVNSDVPGGFAEASSLPSLMAGHMKGVASVGDPGARWADAVAQRVERHLPVALLVAPGFLEDMQVILFLRGLLEARGLTTVVGHARHLHGGRNAIVFRGEQYDGGIAAVVRFYQAEWLSTLRSYGALEALFVGKGTPVTNSGAAVLTESKRLPLVWDRLRASTDAFRSAMPEAREPRDAPWWTEPDRWVIKGTYSNTGDVVIFPDRCSRRQRLALAVRIAAQPTAFVAQRRFHTTPVESPRGATQPCIGVYTIDGRVAGAYARLATSNVVDGSAIDVACLVEAA